MLIAFVEDVARGPTYNKLDSKAWKVSGGSLEFTTFVRLVLAAQGKI